MMNTPPENTKRIRRQHEDEEDDPVTLAYPFRMMNVGEHFPELVKGQRKYCKRCYHVDNIQRRGRWRCALCKLYLCLTETRNCFVPWHTEINM